MEYTGEYEGKTTIDGLELNRSKEWLEEVFEKSSLIFKEKAELWALTTENFLHRKHPQILSAMVELPPLSDAVTDIGIVFFKLGFLKGVQVGEDREKLDKLDKLWKE